MNTSKLKPNRAIILAFSLSILYWIYLFWTATPIIVHDAISYEYIGKVIYREGWNKFFAEGPQREPLYPLLIAWAMALADKLSISYFYTIKFFQILILFITQIASFQLLKRLGINHKLTALTILYIGFSPALVNSAFSLFSEIASYPLILGILFLVTQGWRATLRGERIIRIILISLWLGILFNAIISVKAIFEFVLPVVFLPFILIAIDAFLEKSHKTARNAVIFIAVTSLTVFSFLHSYKSLNEKYNGQYTFTNRGSWMLYGTVERRLVPLTAENILTALSMVPGDGVCNKIFGPQKCHYWTFDQTMTMGVRKLVELESFGIPAKEVDSQLIKLSLYQILEQPFRYGLFHLIESGRMFFWESTQIGFVDYPEWLGGIFRFSPVKDGVRLLMGLLTLTAFYQIFFIIVKNKRLLLDTEDPASEKFQLSLFTFYIIAVVTLLYSFFCVLTRYAFPIVPLHILGISIILQKLFADPEWPHSS